MRKLVLFMHVSLDGFAADANSGLGWISYDSDEYQLTINPVLLGSGIPAYQDIKNKTNLKLVKATTLKSGVVGLHYARV